MQCENGYVKKGVHGILCKKAEEPKDGDLRGIAHALCGHQRFCQNQKCYTMLPGWEKCLLRESTAAAPEIREEGTGEEIPARKTKRTAKKKSAETGAENAQKGEEA